MNETTIQNIVTLVRASRQKVAVVVNAEITLLYWQVGNYIKQELLHNTRATYGKQVIEAASMRLTQEFGKGWSIRHLWNCLKLSDVFPDIQILHTLCAELTWSHFRLLCSIEQATKRDFYVALAKSERWSVRELDAKIDAMLYERTAIATKPEEIIQAEVSNLQNQSVGMMHIQLRIEDPAK